MKVSSNLKNLKRNITVNVQPIIINPDVNQLIDKWNEKLNIINDILESGNIKVCYQDVYQKINDLLLYKIPDQISENFNQLIIKHTYQYCCKLIELSKINNFDEFFERFNEEWDKINKNFILLRKLLIKFEKKYFSKSLSTQTIYSLFLENIREILKKDRSFIFLLSERILYKINEIREYLTINFENFVKNNLNLMQIQNESEILNANSLINKSNSNISIILKAVVFLWETGFYKENFQEFLIKNSTDFYRNVGNNYIHSLRIEDYIKFVELSFENETFLINTYLNEFSQKKLINEMQDILINSIKQKILDKFFSFNTPNQSSNNTNDNMINIESNKSTNNQPSCEELFLRVNHIDFLKKIYFLFRKIKIEDDLKISWISYINLLCNKIYSQYSNNYLLFFQNILELKKNIDTVIKDSFNNDDKMKAAGREGFVKSINLKPNFIADYFARYIDHILTESGRDRQYIIDKIDEFMLIFRHLDAKDMFEGFFIKKLSYRLLYNLSSFKEGETYLIEKLKTECGSVFVTKAEEMIQDIEASIESTLNFHGDKFDNIECNFYVLSSNSWPLNSKIHEGFISNKICELQKNYNDYYNSKNSRKVLKWHLPFCTAELNFKLKNVILEVNGVQCAILYLFNNKSYYSQNNSISLKKMMDISFLDKDIVLNSLKYLTKNVPLLIKTQDNNSSEAYKLNLDFVVSKSRFCINDFSNKEEEAVEEIKEVEERNHEERKFVVDCLIMKVLKKKKQMKQDEIIHEVMGLLKFTCETSLILTRLNNLVTNKYIFKDEKDPDLFRYN